MDWEDGVGSAGFEEFENEEPFFMVRPKGMLFPARLQPGDKVAFISPASGVKDEYVYGAMARFRERGYEPVLMKYALNHEDGNFAATKGDRLMDLFEALQDSDYKAIFCNRGGYGCCQLLMNLSPGLITNNPKWIIGFSDISALLAYWCNSNVASIHGPMAKHLTTMPADDPCTEALFRMLENGGKFEYTVPAHEYNRQGNATGVLKGGNMAVLNDLGGTPDDMLEVGPGEDVILFFEDINEPIYKVNRMLWRLALNGTLALVKGLVFGQFTDYKPDRNFTTMEEMINDFLNKLFILPDIPVAFNFPVGHTSLNYPVTVGAKVSLEVEADTVTLRTE